MVQEEGEGVGGWNSQFFLCKYIRQKLSLFLVCALPLNPDGSAFAETPEYGYCNPAINLPLSYLAL